MFSSHIPQQSDSRGFGLLSGSCPLQGRILSPRDPGGLPIRIFLGLLAAATVVGGNPARFALQHSQGLQVHLFKSTYATKSILRLQWKTEAVEFWFPFWNSLALSKTNVWISLILFILWLTRLFGEYPKNRTVVHHPDYTDILNVFLTLIGRYMLLFARLLNGNDNNKILQLYLEGESFETKMSKLYILLNWAAQWESVLNGSVPATHQDL